MPKIVSAPKIVSLRAIPKSVRVQIILGAWTSCFVADLFVLFFFWNAKKYNREFSSGLCSRGARVPQATNFCLWPTGKTYFFHISLSAGHPGFHG